MGHGGRGERGGEGGGEGGGEVELEQEESLSELIEAGEVDRWTSSMLI